MFVFAYPALSIFFSYSLLRRISVDFCFWCIVTSCFYLITLLFKCQEVSGGIINLYLNIWKSGVKLSLKRS